MSKERICVAFSLPRPRLGWLARLLPAPGTVVFTVLVIIGLLWAQSAGALPLPAPMNAGVSTGTIAYQGRLADTAGQPLTGTYNMTFRLYSAASGGAPLWEEPWNGANSVQVSDGLFNVMLGSLASIPQNIVAANSSLFLGITVGTDSEMTPRVQLGSVPFAVQALTVPDGSITKAKLAADINLTPTDGSITTVKLADKSVSSSKFSPTAEQAGYGPCCVTLSANVQVMPGTQRSIVVTVPSRLFVWLTFDFAMPGTGATAVGKLRLDGQPVGREAIFGGASTRATVASVFAIDIEPGTHTAELIAHSSGATAVLHHTGYNYLLVAR